MSRDAGDDTDHSDRRTRASGSAWSIVIGLALAGAAITTAVCVGFGLSIGLGIGAGVGVALLAVFIGVVTLVEFDDGEIDRLTNVAEGDGDARDS